MSLQLGLLQRCEACIDQTTPHEMSGTSCLCKYGTTPGCCLHADWLMPNLMGQALTATWTRGSLTTCSRRHGGGAGLMREQPCSINVQLCRHGRHDSLLKHLLGVLDISQHTSTTHVSVTDCAVHDQQKTRTSDKGAGSKAK